MKILTAHLQICRRRPAIPPNIAAMNPILPTKTVHVTVEITVAKMTIIGQTAIASAIVH